MTDFGQAQSKNRAVLVGVGVVLGICLLISIALMPRAFRMLSHTRTFRTVGESMEPNLYPGDLIAVDSGYYADHPIADGDVIVFRHNGTVLTKRVLALGGETVEGKDGKLIRNGALLTEPYLRVPDEPSSDDEATFATRLIPPDEVFVAGDWRSRSLDSREADYAPVRRQDVIGKVIYIYSSSHPGQQGRRF